MRYVVIVFLSLMFMGCSTKYATVEGKDISVKVRSIWADVDYDSRVCAELDKLKELDSEGLTKLEELKE